MTKHLVAEIIVYSYMAFAFVVFTGYGLMYYLLYRKEKEKHERNRSRKFDLTD